MTLPDADLAEGQLRPNVWPWLIAAAINLAVAVGVACYEAYRQIAG